MADLGRSAYPIPPAMNTARSTIIGWGSLIAAAAVSFAYAKKGINERRREQYAAGERPTEIKDWRQRIEEPAPQRPNEDGTHVYTKAPSPREANKAAQPGNT